MAVGVEADAKASKKTDSHVDVAALLVATLVATLALAGQPGAWTWLSSLLGAALLGAVYAYYSLPDPAAGGIQKWGSLIALSAVTALSSLLLVAWPAQEYWFSHGKSAACNASMNAARALALGPVPQKDRTAAGPAADDIANDAWGKCIGDMTTERLAWPVGVVFLGTLAFTSIVTSRRRRLAEEAPVMSRTATEPFDEDQRLQWAQAALRSAAESVTTAGDPQVPPDLIPPGGWRWRVLSDLTALSNAVNRDYEQARTRQSRQAWQSRFAGPLATGAGAAVGSIVSAVGAGLVKTNAVFGWVIVVLGILLAVGGSVISANNYVQNRNKQLRFLRLLYDMWDFAYLVLPTASAGDTFTQLDTFRSLWETAGT